MFDRANQRREVVCQVEERIVFSAVVGNDYRSFEVLCPSGLPLYPPRVFSATFLVSVGTLFLLVGVAQIGCLLSRVLSTSL